MKDKWKKLWNFTLDKEKKASLRERAIRGMAGFLVMMIVFTLLSRGARAMTLPVVTTSKIEKKTINQTVKAAGTIEKSKDIGITTIAGLKIQSVEVSKGSNVEAGDTLMTIDLEDIEEKIEQLRKEIKEIDLKTSDTQYNKSLENKDRNTALGRAREDYNEAVSRGDEAVGKAKTEMDEALHDLENFREKSPDELSEAEQATYDPQTEKEQLKANYKEKKEQYEQALKDRDDGIKTAKRAIEDSSKGSEADSTDEIEQMQKEEKQKDLTKLEQLKAAGGIITAPIKGNISEVAAETGDLTPETKVFLLADLSEGLKFVAQVTKEQQKLIAPGDAAAITLSGEKELKDLEIDTISPNDENPEVMDVTVKLGQRDNINVWESGTMSVTKKSKTYSTCVPLQALHEDNGKKYLLVLKETEGVLGKTLEAERMDVTVVEKNNTYAALQDGEVSSEQEFILNYSKEVQDGDRVRQQEQ